MSEWLIEKLQEHNDSLIKERNQLKAENDRLETALATSLFLLKRKIKQLDEARELLKECMSCDTEARIDAWLEANK